MARPASLAVARRTGATVTATGLKLHCAIHTRTSSEECLEQDFNSLDAAARKATPSTQSGW